MNNIINGNLTDKGHEYLESLIQTITDAGVKLDMNEHKLLIALRRTKDTSTVSTHALCEKIFRIYNRM